MSRRFTTFCICCAIGLPFATAVAGPINIAFSVDPGSPGVSTALTPGDVLGPGPVVLIPARSLGLQDQFYLGVFDNLADFSFGGDPIQNPLLFSVDRLAVGLDGTAVFNEAVPGVASAAGDVFLALPPTHGNNLAITGVSIGLTPGFFGDDLDGLNVGSAPRPYTYLAVDRTSASNGFGAGTLASDLLVSAGNGRFGIYASQAMIGLDPFDAIDGLVLADLALDNVADPRVDKALFSLDPFSPDTFTYTGLSYVPCVAGHMSPADVCFTDFTGSFRLWASAADIGLRPEDNVDALATVPEPGGLALVFIALLLLAWTTFGAAVGSAQAHPRGRAKSPGFISCVWLIGLIGVWPSMSVAAPSAEELIGPSFYGKSPPVAGSQATLLLREDLVNEPVFFWRSKDTVLQEIDTGDFVKAKSWRYFAGNPARLLFEGTAKGVTFYADVLFEPYNRAVVDVVLRNDKRIRYLLVAGCDAFAIPAPAAKIVAGHTWTLMRTVSPKDGLVVNQAMLGTRLMARQISLPYVNIKTTAFSGNVELTPNAANIVGRSRLIDFWEGVDENQLAIEATYAIDHISSANSRSCVLLTQHYEFSRLQNRFSFAPDASCEPSEQIGFPFPPPFRSLQCARFKSTVKYAYVGDRDELLVSLQAPQRMHFQPDNRFRSTINFLLDYNSFDPVLFGVQVALYIATGGASPFPSLPFAVLPGPPIPSFTLSSFLLSGPPLPFETVLSGIRRGQPGDWDNYHHTWDTTLGLPAPPPGCPECLHMHWRWGAWLKFPPGKVPGQVLIPAGSDQDLQLGVVNFKAGETHPADWRTLLDGEALTGANGLAVLWYESTGYRRRDAFFVHEGFFGSPIRVLLNNVTPVPAINGFDYQFVVTNTSDVPIAGPVYLVLDSLTHAPATASLGVTRNIAPLGSPYFLVIGAGDFQPGQAETITIQIPNVGSDPAAVGYNARILTGDLKP